MVERKRIGLREIRALEPGQDIWDRAVAGFGARRQKGEAVSYVLIYRTPEGRQRRYTIGRHGSPWTPEMARARALELLGEIVRGNDPAADKKAQRQAETVNDLCDQYWADALSGKLITRRRQPKKASTLLSDQGRIDRHIRPLLGTKKVASVTSADIEAAMHQIAAGRTAARVPTGRPRGLSNVRGGTGAASRTIGLLGAIFAYAVKNRMRPDNPVHGVLRPADVVRVRRLTDEEYGRVGDALRQAHDARHWPAAIAATQFAALSGWRIGEVLALRWGDIDLARRTAILPDTKTGRSLRPLSRHACDVIRGMSRAQELVFPATRGTGPMTGFRRHWNKIMAITALPSDVTPHVLRHSYASLASELGLSEATVAALIGHQGASVTSRYIHVADAALLASADVVAARIGALMGEPGDRDVILLHQNRLAGSG